MSPHIPYVPNKTTISVCPILFLLITPLSAIILKKILCIVLFKYVSLKGKDSKKIFTVPLSHLNNGRSLKSSNVWSVRVHIFHIDQNVLYFTVNLFKSVSKQGPHIAFS